MYSGYLLLSLNGSEIYMILRLLYNVFSYDFKCLTGGWNNWLYELCFVFLNFIVWNCYSMKYSKDYFIMESLTCMRKLFEKCIQLSTRSDNCLEMSEIWLFFHPLNFHMTNMVIICTLSYRRSVGHHILLYINWQDEKYVFLIIINHTLTHVR